MRDELAFSRTLSASQRRVVHLVAQKLGVFHYSVGEGEERYAVVTRSEGRGGDRVRSLFFLSSLSSFQVRRDSDFSVALFSSRDQTLRHQPSRSSVVQNGPPSTANLYAASPSLRNKSSMPDLSHLHGPTVSRDPTRAILSQRSTMNLREGYATVGGTNVGHSNGPHNHGSMGPAPRRSQTSNVPFQQQQQQDQQQLLAPPASNGNTNGNGGGPVYQGSPKGTESTESLLSNGGPLPPASQGSDGQGGLTNGPSSSSPSASPGAPLLRQPRGPPPVEVGRNFGSRRFAAPGSAGASPSARVGGPPGGLAGGGGGGEGEKMEGFATSHEPLEF